MQITVYYSKDEEGVIEKLRTEAHRSRRSVGRMVLAILEEHFPTDGLEPHTDDLPEGREDRKSL